MFSAFQSELVHQVFFGLLPGLKYSEQFIELKRAEEKGLGLRYIRTASLWQH